MIILDTLFCDNGESGDSLWPFFFTMSKDGVRLMFLILIFYHWEPMHLEIIFVLVGQIHRLAHLSGRPCFTFSGRRAPQSMRIHSCVVGLQYCTNSFFFCGAVASVGGMGCVRCGGGYCFRSFPPSLLPSFPPSHTPRIGWEERRIPLWHHRDRSHPGRGGVTIHSVGRKGCLRSLWITSVQLSHSQAENMSVLLRNKCSSFSANFDV